MLAALLTILKIAGIVLLVILAILLIAILLILFVPIRYGAKASYDKEVLASATATWLLHLVSFRADYRDDLTWSLRVLGINILSEKTDEGAEAEKAEPGPRKAESKVPEETVAGKSGEDEKETADLTPAEGQKETVAVTVTESYEKGGKEKVTLTVTESFEEGEKETVSVRGAPAGGFNARASAIYGFFSSVRNFFVRLYERVRERIRYFRTEFWPDLMDKKDQLLWLLTDPANVATRHLLVCQLKKLLNHIKPREVEGDVKFGFEDPYLTGQILVAISPFYGLYGEHFNVMPVFGEEVAAGRVDLRGRVRIFNVAAAVIRMMMDKNFRSLLNKFLNS